MTEENKHKQQGSASKPPPALDESDPAFQEQMVTAEKIMVKRAAAMRALAAL